MLLRTAMTPRFARLAGVRHHLSTQSFGALEKSMWEKGAGNYGSTFGAVTKQAADALLDGAGVPRTSTAVVKRVYSVRPAIIPGHNIAAHPGPQGEVDEAVLARLNTEPAFKVLDVATGPGIIAAEAARRGATDVTGIDFSADMIKAAAAVSEAYPGVMTFEVGDAEALPYKDATFDAVVLAFVLLHLPQPEKALSEAYRVLKPGGKIAFSVWAPPPANKGFATVLDAIAAVGNKDVSLPGAPLDFFHFADAKNATAALTAAGFGADSVKLSTIPCVAPLESEDSLFEMFATATARTRATLELQTPAQLAAIKSEMAATVQAGFDGAFVDGQARSTSWLKAVPGTDAPLYDGRPSGRIPYQVPMPCVVASASKAGGAAAAPKAAPAAEKKAPKKKKKDDAK